MSRLLLPNAPAHLAGPVKAWPQAVTIPTYLPAPADHNPMFLENRVYQGSSGRVYPLPFTDRISDQRQDRSWDAIHLENEHLRLMILPQIGGRIHLAIDKATGCDLFYRQDVIKPALVGLAGPWISGGVEFNWPQHHRPSTFMPVDTHIERHPDGSVTVWCSEHEPMGRMKGMHGVCLHPGRAVIELKVRLYNRTPLVQTFLWWANVAVRVHERYQSFFPRDVTHVADHARRATSRFPLCEGSYYGVDYAARARNGVPPDEQPAHFIPPPGLYPPNDLSWYANIPVPTSYMILNSRFDFFGGYDHAADVGFIHVASHHIAPGKKQWTWGNHAFGYAWDRNLTDEGGPYIELMAGVYTDNQPDFSFLHPGETRIFSQFWYPIHRIGPAQAANVDAALSVGHSRIGVAVSRPFPNARILVRAAGRTLLDDRCDLAPASPYLRDLDDAPPDLHITLLDATGAIILEHAPQPAPPADAPAPATEPPLPRDIASVDELYLTGLHLEQYRHATRRPEAYWQEALRRDPSDSRCNNAMGLWRLRRGEFAQAADHFGAAIQALTRRNPNPRDGEPFYNLGLALRFLGRDDDAYAALYKATWNYPWQSPAFTALAEIDCARHHWQAALDHLDRALRVNADHLGARVLKAVILRKLGQRHQADSLLHETMELDPLDHRARYLAGQPLTCDTQVRIDLTLDSLRAGLASDAAALLEGIRPDPGAGPIVHYLLAFIHDQRGDPARAQAARAAAAAAPADYCFPARLEEIAILEAAIRSNPHDARAMYYLGNLLYDRRRHEEAIDLWERAIQIDPAFPTAWRNLGIARFNIRHDPASARDAYDRALAADPNDARLLYERDQLWKRTGIAPADRLKELERHPDLVRQRDDLSIELCDLLNQAGRHADALRLLQSRCFQPWEGGEGLALAQHVRTHLALGQQPLQQGDAAAARALFEAALHPPETLGEARHLLANPADVHWWIGVACQRLGDLDAAERHWTRSAEFRGDFQLMNIRPFSEMTLYSALALRALGQADQANRLLRDLLAYARDLRGRPATVDYFATSLPAMLLFDDDPSRRQLIQSMFLEAQALLGLGDEPAAMALLDQVLDADPAHPLVMSSKSGMMVLRPCPSAR